MVVGGTVSEGGNVASGKNEQRQAREARERLRRFTARQSLHVHQQRRRKRDNVLAVAGVLVVIALATATQVFFFTAGPGVSKAATPSASASPTPQTGENVGNIPAASLAENRQWTGTLTLNEVPLGVTLDGAAAPQAVAVFIQEVRDGYFPGKTCHRLTDAGSLLIQCGSLDGTGASDPGFRFGPIENAPADGRYPAGTIAMARAGGDAYSQGHQFFIMYGDGAIDNDSAGGYSVIGHVTSGLDKFVTDIASAGVAGDGHDGAPAIPTTITDVAIQ
jgi:peptidyl-prolyl cis-trans isomerase B (cyclophilin B)